MIILTSNVNWGNTLFKYLILLVIIFISLILIALVRRSFRKEASLKKVKAKCIKAKNYALKIKKQNNRQELLIASTKLNKLTSILCDATWLSTRTAEENKDVVLDDLTSSIDQLATYVSNYAEETFYTKDDYDKTIDYVISNIDDIVDRINNFVKDTSLK